MCADLNSLPDSGVVEFLSTGRVPADHGDFKELGYKDCLRKLSATENKAEFTHPFRIGCAYSEDVLPFTNYTYVNMSLLVRAPLFAAIEGNCKCLLNASALI